MAKATPPRINSASLSSHSKDDVHRFLERLYRRTVSNLEALEEENDNINESYIAFETLGALMPLLCSGYLGHEDVKGAYPVDSWRSDTVTIPAELLEVLVRPFNEYSAPGNNKSLDACFGFERITGQGKSPMRKVQNQKDRMREIAASVAYERIFLIGVDESATSLEVAYSVAAEKHNVSTDTARRAFKEFGEKIIQSLQAES